MVNHSVHFVIERRHYVNRKGMNTLQTTWCRLWSEFLLEKFPTARTFPQITAHGEYVGGFNELEIWSEGYRTV